MLERWRGGDPKQVKVPVSDALPQDPDELRQAKARTWIPADTTRGAAGCARCVEMEEDPNNFCRRRERNKMIGGIKLLGIW